MVAPKKETEKLTVRQFKSSNNDWWLNLKHWTIINGELILAAGGLDITEERIHMEKYLKSKKLI